MRLYNPKNIYADFKNKKEVKKKESKENDTDDDSVKFNLLVNDL